MTRFWGDGSWKQGAYAESPQYALFSPPDLVKQDNETITPQCHLEGNRMRTTAAAPVSSGVTLFVPDAP